MRFFFPLVLQIQNWLRSCQDSYMSKTSVVRISICSNFFPKEQWWNWDKHSDLKSTRTTRSSLQFSRMKKKWSKKRITIIECSRIVPHSIKIIIYHVKNAQDTRATGRVQDSVYNNYKILGNIYQQRDEVTQYLKKAIDEGSTSRG